MAKKTDDGEQGASGNRRPALSEHPAFPMIIAAWFAALLSIGTMVVPAILVERIVVASGLPALLPAAAPPLGMTAQLLIAFTTGLIGGLIGLVLARRLAGRNNAVDAFRPIQAHEELGDGGLDAPVAVPSYEARAPEVPNFLLKASGENDDNFAAPPVWAAPVSPEADREDDGESSREGDVNEADAFDPAPSCVLPVEEVGEKDAQPPLDELGLAQLVQRLGTSLANRRARLAANGDTVQRGDAESRSRWLQDEPAAAEDEAAIARAAFLAASTPNPSDSGDQSGPVPLRKPFESPEQALRYALETLQRLNGAA